MTNRLGIFKAQKDGRPVAARSVEHLVLWPMAFSFFVPSAIRLSSRSPWRRRSLLRTWQGRRGAPTAALRGSFIHRVDGFNEECDRFAKGHVPGIVIVGPSANGRASFLSHQGAQRRINGVVVHVAQLGAKFFGCEAAGFGFDGRCHFAFSFRPGVGLVLFSEDTIPNRLAIVNEKNK